MYDRFALSRAGARAAWLLSEGRATEAEALIRAARGLSELSAHHAGIR